MAEDFHTEIQFELPRGYQDDEGNLHRRGVMRMANAGDEIKPQADPRVRQNEAFLMVILLSRVITKLGEVPVINTGLVERLPASDFAYLQDLYYRFNRDGANTINIQCPSCGHEFDVDLGPPGES